MIARLLRLYPRAWRDRYGAELGWLVGELIDTGETTPVRAGLDLLAGAVTAWWRTLVRRAVLLRLTAVVAAGGALAVAVGRLGPAGPVQTYVRAHPLGVLVLLVQLGWLLTEYAQFVRGRRSRPEPRPRPRPRPEPRRDQHTFWGTLALCFLASTAVLNLAPMAVPAATIRLGTPATAGGLVLILAGTALRERAFQVLSDRYHSFTVEVTPDQQVMATGPYRLLRHPGHTGMLLVCAGVGLVSANWIGLAAQILLPLGVVVWRIRVEEAVMLGALGERYRRYAVSRKRLVPLVW